MSSQRPRKPPSLDPASDEPAGPDLFVPPRRSPAGAADAPPGDRRRLPLAAMLIWTLLGSGALVLLTVLALRWMPVPTSAFMLQSPVKPVRYEWVPAERIADSMRAAVVAAEDQKFFEHRGFDFEAIEKAIDQNRKRKKRRGASTISQQTAKNLFLWSGGGYFRKGLEAGFTVLIETLWSKDRILEVYLNIAEFGSGVYGVEAASRLYFGKSAAALTAGEAARLAAVLPSPRRWSARNPGSYVQSRSAWILRQMGYGPRPDTAPEPEPFAELDPDMDDAGEVVPAPPAEPAPETGFETPPADQAGSDGAQVETRPLHDPGVLITDPIPIEPDQPTTGADGDEEAAPSGVGEAGDSEPTPAER